MKNRFRSSRLIFLISAVSGLGFSMPSCPGQHAIQSQVDVLTQSNQDLSKKVQTLSSQLSEISGEMNQVKQLLPQMTNVIQAQKTALDQLGAAVADLKFTKNSRPEKVSHSKGGRSGKHQHH